MIFAAIMYQIPERSCNRLHRVLKNDDDDDSEIFTLSEDVDCSGTC